MFPSRAPWGARRVALRLRLVAALAVLCPSASIAGSIPDNLKPSLSYEVTGVIRPVCSLNQGQRQVSLIGLANPATDTVRASTVDLPFALDCNSPVRLRLQSDNGGLKSARTTSDPAFLATVGYRATVHLPGMAAALQCRSQDMASTVASCQAETRTAVASGPGRVAVEVAAQDGLLLAGTYRDRVTLTITPVLGGEDNG